MNKKWRRLTHAEWTKMIASGGYDTVGVLKFDNGRYIAPKLAHALYKAYWHKVDRTMFGTAADKGYGVTRWCFTELGSDGCNLHMHFAAVAPFDPMPFCAVLNALWADFHVRTAGCSHNWITPIQDSTRAAGYTSKSTKQGSDDTTGLAASFQPDLDLDHGTFNPEAQAQRISNRLTAHQLEQAYSELHRHISETERRLKLRQIKAR